MTPENVQMTMVGILMNMINFAPSKEEELAMGQAMVSVGAQCMVTGQGYQKAAEYLYQTADYLATAGNGSEDGGKKGEKV
jgi:hypothetical protein